jgi:hypothetical protein
MPRSEADCWLQVTKRIGGLDLQLVETFRELLAKQVASQA